jgi:hypothetical protein
LIEVARRQMAAHTPAKTVPLYTVLRERLTDPRDPRGVAHTLP